MLGRRQYPARLASFQIYYSFFIDMDYMND